MIWAIKDNERIKASPKIKALCPTCEKEVRARCGSVKVWHWAHVSLEECDNWAEPESEWHIKWKLEYSKEQQEVVLGNHRADIRCKDGTVVELQNSSISTEVISQREKFYGNMVWLLNGDKFARNLLLRKKDKYYSFRWKSPPKSWWVANKPLYLDLDSLVKHYEKRRNHLNEVIQKTKDQYHHIIGNDELLNLRLKDAERDIEFYKGKIFLIKKLHNNIPCGGWGVIISKEEFLKQYE